VQVIAFALVLIASVVLALGVARLALGVMLEAMAGQLPLAGVVAHWRRAAVVGALFWLAYLVPVLAASETVQAPVAQLIRLLRP
jgi:hypothetical protein